MRRMRGCGPESVLRRRSHACASLRPARGEWSRWGSRRPLQASGGPVEVVASGLDSPRHLEFGDRGDLFVAEAGRGGTREPCFDSPEGFACVGNTGAVTKVDRHGRQSRVAKGLASYANKETGGGGIGPHGIAVLGKDTVIVTNGGPTAPTVQRYRRRRDARGHDRGEPDRDPVRPHPADRPASGSRSRSPTRTRSSATSTRTRSSATRRSTPIRSTSRSTAYRSSMPTPAATRSTRSTCSARISNLALFPNRDVPTPFPFPATCRRCRRRSRSAATAATTSASSPASRSRSAARTSTGSSPRGGTPRGRRERLHDDHGHGVRQGRHAVRAGDRPNSLLHGPATRARSGRSRERRQAAAATCPPENCRSPAASRSVTTASTSRPTPPPPAPAR